MFNFSFILVLSLTLMIKFKQKMTLMTLLMHLPFFQQVILTLIFKLLKKIINVTLY